MEKIINHRYTSFEKLPPYLKLPEKAVAYGLTIEIGTRDLQLL
jgi:hypothetical protein